MLLLRVWTDLMVSRMPDVYNPDSYILSLLPTVSQFGGRRMNISEKGPCFGVELFPLTWINNLYNN